MQATTPHVDVPGDNEEQVGYIRPHIMARSGTCMGMSPDLAVWRFGIMPESEKGQAYGIYIKTGGFLWVLATRKMGRVRETFTGYAFELPTNFRRILDWEPK